MASLTYVCFVPAKGLIGDLTANSSNIAFEVPLASKRWWHHHFDARFILANIAIVSSIVFVSTGTHWATLHTFTTLPYPTLMFLFRRKF